MIPADAIAIEVQDSLAECLHTTPDAVMDALGLDGRLVCAPYAGPVKEGENGRTLCEWGLPVGEWMHSGVSAPLGWVETVRQVEEYALPDAGARDYAAAAALARQLDPQYAVRGPYSVPVFTRACSLLTMEGAMMTVLSRPAVFEAVLWHIGQWAVEYCSRLLDACGDAMPILCTYDDFATQRGLMISPRDWRKFVKPVLADIFQTGKDRGKFVWFHSCGNVIEVLPDLIDMGIDVWETVQLHTFPISAYELKRQYGRHVTFFGGVCTQRLPWRTPEEVRAEVQDCILALGKRGGYIGGPDHHIKSDVPPENAIALYDAIREFAAPGYTS
jgi:uroporphyrinogen decarboxylase